MKVREITLKVTVEVDGPDAQFYGNLVCEDETVLQVEIVEETTRKITRKEADELGFMA